MRTMATQAPAVNLVTPSMTNTMPDSTAPVALKAWLRRQCGWVAVAPPVHDHAGLRQGERKEDPDRVQR